MNSKTIKNYIKEILNKRKLYFPGKLKTFKQYGLIETQVYQDGINFNKVLKKSISKSLSKLKLKKKYKIASMGTCFAEEVSRFLKNKDDLGTYLQLEENIWDFPVNWGRIYTIQNLKQIIEYSLNKKTPIYIENHKSVFFDPLREKSVKGFVNKKDMSKNIISHRKFSRSILKEVDVLVITLGQNETWRDLKNKTYWGIVPSVSIKKKNKKRFIIEESTVEKNLQDLKWITNSILKINKSIQFLFTVSPIPSKATFIGQDVILQSFAGKCILRSSIHELMKEAKSNIFYFPSFEIAIAKNNETYKEDNRHIKFAKIKEIFSFLKN